MGTWNGDALTDYCSFLRLTILTHGLKILCFFFLENSSLVTISRLKCGYSTEKNVSKNIVDLQSNTILQPGEEIPADFDSKYYFAFSRWME